MAFCFLCVAACERRVILSFSSALDPFVRLLSYRRFASPDLRVTLPLHGAGVLRPVTEGLFYPYFLQTW